MPPPLIDTIEKVLEIMGGQGRHDFDVSIQNIVTGSVVGFAILPSSETCNDDWRSEFTRVIYFGA